MGTGFIAQGGQYNSGGGSGGSTGEGAGCGVGVTMIGTDGTTGVAAAVTGAAGGTTASGASVVGASGEVQEAENNRSASHFFMFDVLVLKVGTGMSRE